MRTVMNLPMYHRMVLLLYITLLPFTLFYFSVELDYGFLRNDLIASLGIVLSLSVVGLIVLKFKGLDIHDFKRNNILLTVAYAAVFSIPEEILFRGIVQGLLFSELKSPVLMIFLSSLIFGLAHLFNGLTSTSVKGLNWKFSGITFIGGIPLGTLYWLTGSLLLPTILHILFIAFLRLYK